MTRRELFRLGPVLFTEFHVPVLEPMVRPDSRPSHHVDA
jgi:hypothetical protein